MRTGADTRTFSAPVSLPVNIDDVGEQLEGVEGNTHRQSDLRYLLRKTKKRMCHTGEKRQVFENTQEPQHEHTVSDQIPSLYRGIFGSLNHKSKSPGSEYHAEQKQQILWSAPGVKNKRKNKQYHVFLPDIARQIISDQIQGKKEKYKK